MNIPPVKYDLVRLEGGWDEVTPSLQLKAGVLKDVLNFECNVTGGYSRIGGFERFDGRLKPSDASYRMMQVTSFTNTPAAGQTLTGQTSTATGVIAYVGTNFVVLTKVVGAFTETEVVKVGATTIGTATPLTVALTHQRAAQYTNYSADIYRADITAVPGSGPLRGAVKLKDIYYAFRDNAGGTAVDLYKSSTSGWVQVPFEYEIGFSNANTSVGDGDVLTHTATGFTATIRRVMVETGTLASGINTGRLIISAQTGTMTPAGAATSTGGGTLTTTSVPTAITMAVGGKFEFDVSNFLGQASGKRIYGCDGYNRCFEFDGTIFCPINTTATPDTPKYIKVHKSHLFVAIGSDIFNSAIEAPYDWSTTHGAAHKALGDTCAGFLVQTGSQTIGTMMIGAGGNVIMLYGSSSADWNYVTHSQGVGVLDRTMQNLSQAFFLSGQGVTSLAASQVFGNFESSTLTRNIKNFIESKRSKVACSSISRTRSQYRLFFNDGYAIYCTIVNGKFLGATQVRLDKIPYCSYSGEMDNGDEVLLFGGTDGYVYEMDKGSSFDGNPMYETMTTNWNNSGSARTLKRYRKLSLEISGKSYVGISLSYQLGYGSSEISQPNPGNYELGLSAKWYFDTPGLYLDIPGLFFDSTGLLPLETDLEGEGENIQITISGNTDYILPYTVNSAIFHYTPRRGIR